MIKKFECNKPTVNLALLFSMVYMVSYITRTNFGTIIAEMEKSTAISRSLLSMSITGSFITYGAGQIISGIFGDKFSPKKLIEYGLVTTVCMNILIPLCNSSYQMLFIWCINGFAQSFMWPPMVKLLVACLGASEYKGACAKVSYGGSLGTIILYLLSPIIISWLSWKAVFWFSALCGTVMIIVWEKLCPNPNIETAVIKEKFVDTNTKKSNVFLAPAMMGVMLAIILQGMLRDGVSTWMPSYISDVYSISSVISILTGIILPLFSILSFWVSSKLYMYKFNNPVICAGVFFCSGVLSAVAIGVSAGQNAILSVLFFALLTGSMHGVNLMLVSMLPPFFSKSGNVSTVSGVLNSCTYIGSAISTYGIAFISEKTGWNYVVVQWSLIAVAGTVLCLLCGKSLMKKVSACDDKG